MSSIEVSEYPLEENRSTAVDKAVEGSNVRDLTMAKQNRCSVLICQPLNAIGVYQVLKTRTGVPPMRHIKPVAMLAVAALMTMGTVCAQENPGQDPGENTAEQRQAAAQARRAARENMTEEQRAAARERFKNMSDEDRQAMRQRFERRSAANRQAMRKHWQSMSETERQAARERIGQRKGQNPGQTGQRKHANPPQGQRGNSE
jgi:hypothetical protein